MSSNTVSPQGPPPARANVNEAAYQENGRWYGEWRKGKYMFPCDDMERDRLDIFHKFFLVTLRDQLHSAPVVPGQDLRILDLGTGTGIWAIDMADRYRDAKVMGIDLMLMQPLMIPRNLRFFQADMESPWRAPMEGSWDLIHLRMLNGSIQSWPILYTKIFSYLKPNGSIEQVEIDWLPRCDDGTLPQNASLHIWAKELLSTMDEAKQPMRVDPRTTKSYLQAAGFVDITEQVIQIPYNSWPVDPHKKEIGLWFNLGFTQGLVALTLAPLTRIKGRSTEYVLSLVKEVETEVRNRQHHVYCRLYVWRARRPEEIANKRLGPDDSHDGEVATGPKEAANKRLKLDDSRREVTIGQ